MVCGTIFRFLDHFWSSAHKLSALARWGLYGFLEEIKTNRITWKTSIFHGVCKKLQPQLDGVRNNFSVFGPFLVRCSQVKRSRSMGTLWLFKRDKNKQNHIKNQHFSWGMQKVTGPTWWCAEIFCFSGPFLVWYAQSRVYGLHKFYYVLYLYLKKVISENGSVIWSWPKMHFVFSLRKKAIF